MSLVPKALVAALGALALSGPAAAADDDEPPGVRALEDLRDGDDRVDPVQNRFFLKAKRFELTPMVGTVPTNDFVNRFNFGVNFGYHFSEKLAITGIFTYSPDLGKSDVKALVPLLLDRAEANNQGDIGSFRQPYEKVIFSTAIGARWTPVYGKINILGEVVANFDFWGFLGVGLVVQNEYRGKRVAGFDGTDLNASWEVEGPDVEVRPAPVIGLGADFFITQTVALRLDGRFYVYLDDDPIFRPDTQSPTGITRAVPLFSGSVGVAIFVPKMKPRLYDF